MEDAADFLAQRLAAFAAYADPQVNAAELYPRTGRREPRRENRNSLPGYVLRLAKHMISMENWPASFFLQRLDL